MNSSESDRSLSIPLADWRVAPPRDPQFRARVWARIEAARTAPTWGGYVRAHAPAVAGALVLAVAAGALGGRERARAHVAAESARLAAAYVESLDPRLMGGRTKD